MKGALFLEAEADRDMIPLILKALNKYTKRVVPKDPEILAFEEKISSSIEPKDILRWQIIQLTSKWNRSKEGLENFKCDFWSAYSIYSESGVNDLKRAYRLFVGIFQPNNTNYVK